MGRDTGQKSAASQRLVSIPSRILVVIQGFLPPSVTLHPYFDASEYHLLPTPKVYTELHYIAIVDREWFRFSARLTESDMVEKSTGRAFHIFDIPLPLGTPEFAMSPADNLRFESHRSRRWGIWRRVRIRITLGISPNTNDAVFVGKSPGCGRKC